MQYSVRIATPADRPAIDAFADLVVHDAYDVLVGVEYAQSLLDEWWGDALDDDIRLGHVLVATAGDEIIGITQFEEFGDEPIMWKLYVHPDHRSKGIGKQLTTELVRMLPNDTERLITEHIASNTRAGAFYEREGFAIRRTEPDPDPRLSIVWRAKELQPARRASLMSLAWW